MPSSRIISGPAAARRAGAGARPSAARCSGRRATSATPRSQNAPRADSSERLGLGRARDHRRGRRPRARRRARRRASSSVGERRRRSPGCARSRRSRRRADAVGAAARRRGGGTRCRGSGRRRCRLQAVDRLVAAVDEQHHGHLQPLLRGGRELGRRHQVRAVADHDVDLAAAGLAPCRMPEPGRDLVAHAREGELEVRRSSPGGVSHSFSRSPGLPAGGRDDPVARPHARVERRAAPRPAPSARPRAAARSASRSPRHAASAAATRLGACARRRRVQPAQRARAARRAPRARRRRAAAPTACRRRRRRR